MERTVYVASALTNWSAAQALMNKLEQAGLAVVHDWASLYERELFGEPCPDDLSAVQIEAVGRAGCTILLTPGGRGAHVEYGAALGAGRKTVVVVSPGAHPIGFYRLADRLVTSADEAVRAADALLR